MKKLILLLILLCLPVFVLAQTALVNINTASSKELESLTGIGKTIAGYIIDYRNINGPFKTIEDIQKVNKIKEGVFSKIKDFITVSSTGSTDNTSAVNSDNSANFGDNNSAHTGENDLSNYEKSETFKIGAGRERLATVRTPILFSALQNKKGKETNSFTWSFGDGASAMGVKVYHAYQFPGRYNVVLNGSIDAQEEAIARTTVLVTEANLKITTIDFLAGYVEITNNSDKEQNLNNWTLRAGDKIYFFPTDTIISPLVSIKISLKIIGFINPDIKEIILAYPDGETVSGAGLQNSNDLSKIADLKKQLVKIKQQIAEKTIVAKVPETESQISRDSVSGVTIPKNVIILTKEPGWLEKIKHAIFK